MNDADRKAKNAARLKLIDPTIRKQVASVLATLEYYGQRPLIDKDVWRSPATQLSMFRRGVSKLRYGFHNATRNGKPASLAADIIDADKGWAASIRFWVLLAYASKAQGLGAGIYWGLSAAQKKAIDAAFELAKSGKRIPLRVDRDLGWDAAHLEVKGITVAQAKAGKRPAR